MITRYYEERPPEPGRDQIMWDIFSSSKRLNWMEFDEDEIATYSAEHSTGDCSMWSEELGFFGSILENVPDADARLETTTREAD